MIISRLCSIIIEDEICTIFDHTVAVERKTRKKIHTSRSRFNNPEALSAEEQEVVVHDIDVSLAVVVEGCWRNSCAVQYMLPSNSDRSGNTKPVDIYT